MRRTRSLSVVALFAALLMVAAACGKSDSDGTATGGSDGGSESAAELPTYDVKAVDGLSGTPKELADAGKITIGVKADQPNLGYQDPDTNEYSGFDIEIAKMIAADLGIDADGITFKQVPSKNRETALANGEVDLYVGTYTINDERKEQVSFAGPYFVAGQDLLVQKDDDDIKGPDDLDGKNVCSATGSTPIERIKTEHPKAKTTEFDVYSKCVDALLDGEVDAVTTDDAILAGYAAEEPDDLKVVGNTFSEEPYGVGLAKGDTELQDFVASAIKRHEDSGDYEKAYDATLGRSGTKMPEIPAITEGKASA
ncbi:glutamate ABC transporter substrate-binding protein [Aquihabitans sp. G128]|uniref:glutamate ABC transporter substrate-binding protein n=1 Tax=Aquihabitans sp. G128 TaxID=2849779 RepID=UPI001C20F8D5|nr:glutamate ABC transporter substrate-binding protein [Aquihabitans sp. G128]QXC60432.1 glutamate ABC transporter substrate-binding protein [Aquihabitans sp. G128]